MPNNFSPHINFAHNLWKLHLKTGNSVIDATCGNGKDSLFLANLILNNDKESDKAMLYLFDIQEQSIEKTKKKLSNNLSISQMKKIQLFNQNHENLQNHVKSKINLIVYNLGYLPGGNKQLTTKEKTTIASIRNGLELLLPGGVISITCYPGHEEGEKEEKAILSYIADLDPKKHVASYHHWINKIKAPSIVWLSKKS